MSDYTYDEIEGHVIEFPITKDFKVMAEWAFYYTGQEWLYSEKVIKYGWENHHISDAYIWS